MYVLVEELGETDHRNNSHYLCVRLQTSNFMESEKASDLRYRLIYDRLKPFPEELGVLI